MQQTCTQCGTMIPGNSQFCTNCGAPRTPAQPYAQSWAPTAPPQPQVPSWAQSQGGMYQQQQQVYGGANQNAGGSLGFGGSNDDRAKKLLMIAGLSIVGAIVLFIGCVALAFILPPPFQTFFIVVAILLIVIPWIIYNQIRRIIRRTVGSFWRFF